MPSNIYSTATYMTMHRSKFDLKVPHKTSVPFGKMVPVGMPQDVLPADTWKLKVLNVTRMLTPVAPIMDDISMDIYGFFINWRVIWSKAKNFFGENDQEAWTLVQNIDLPLLKLKMWDSSGTGLAGVYTSSVEDFYDEGQAVGRYLYLVDNAVSPTKILDSIFTGTLFDYFGLPFVYPNMEVLGQIKTLYDSHENNVSLFLEEIEQLSFRAVQAVYNEFFRNENIIDPILDLGYGDADKEFDLRVLSRAYAMHKNGKDLVLSGFDSRLWFVPKVARWKDLFTSCLPAPQRGPSVSLPLNSTNAVVKTANTDLMASNGFPLRVDTINMTTVGVPVNASLGFDVGENPSSGPVALGKVPVKGYLGLSGTGSSIGGPTNLYADLSNVAMATINQLRYAFAVQRYYEKLARGGARYTEYLQVMFGVKNSDAVLQRPQFLGGTHQRINVQQVLQTSQTDTTPLGSTGAYSVTGFQKHTFTNSFGEFGILLNFACIRKEHTYCQGMDKRWTKKDVWDIYNPTFAHIGEVPVMKNEVYWQPGNTDVLGYNEAWYEYRSQAAHTTALLNPLAPNNLSVFVLTDVYESAPTLSEAFISEDANGLDRALVANANVTDQFICDFLFDYDVSRVMPVRSYPGLIDHF